MSLDDYLTDATGLDWAAALSAWAWLLPDRVRPWVVTRFGDLALVYPDGSVHVLDVTLGTDERAAGDRDEFCRFLDEPGNATRWLMTPLADRLVAAGVRPGPGKCYGFRTPPVLGGHYDLANVAVLPLGQQLGFLGELHEQLRDVADGDFVSIVRRSGKSGR